MLFAYFFVKFVNWLPISLRKKYPCFCQSLLEDSKTMPKCWNSLKTSNQKHSTANTLSYLALFHKVQQRSSMRKQCLILFLIWRIANRQVYSSVWFFFFSWKFGLISAFSFPWEFIFVTSLLTLIQFVIPLHLNSTWLTCSFCHFFFLILLFLPSFHGIFFKLLSKPHSKTHVWNFTD